MDTFLIQMTLTITAMFAKDLGKVEEDTDPTANLRTTWY